MPKRSLHPGNGDQKKIERLNQAVEAMLARNDGRVGNAGADIEPLVHIAAELRNLPRASFKARLNSALGGKKRMSTVAEPVRAVRVTASPRLAFRDPAKAIEFYERALGAKEKFRFQIGDSIPHAELTIGESSIDVTGEWPEGGRFSAETLGHSPISISIQVPDVDRFAEHAVAEGMKMVREPKDQFYGHRDATLEDPFGYSWAVFTVKEEMSVEEMHRRMRGLSEGPEGGKVEASTATEKRPGPVPPGYHTVTPYLVAQDADTVINFVKKTFGGEEIFRAVGSAGGYHCEVRVEDSMLMIGAAVRPCPGRVTPCSAHFTCTFAIATRRTRGHWRRAGSPSWPRPTRIMGSGPPAWSMPRAIIGISRPSSRRDTSGKRHRRSSRTCIPCEPSPSSIS